MGLGEWFSDRMHDVEKVTHDVTSEVTQGAASAERFVNNLATGLANNFSGGHVQGQDPAKIFRWFHDGPGTEDYQTAQATFRTVGEHYGESAKNIQSAKQTLDSGWSGPAAEKAKAALSKVTNNFDKTQEFSNAAHDQLGGQIGTFHETKSRVVQVPDKPPHGGGIMTAVGGAPGLIAGGVADYQVGKYQNDARNNQQAYQSYGNTTVPQGEQLPVQLITASQPHDTSAGNHQTMTGHSSAQPYQYSGGSPAGLTAPQQAGGAPAPVRQSTYQAPVSSPSPQGHQYVNPGTTNTASAGSPVSPPTAGGGYAGGPVAGGSGGGSTPGESQRYTNAVPYESPAEEFAEGSVPRGASGGVSPLAEALGGVAAGGVGAGLGAGAKGDSVGRSWRSRGRAFSGEEEPGLKSGKGVDAEPEGPKAGTTEPKPPAEPGARSAARAMEADERALRESARGAKGAAAGEEVIPPGGAAGKDEDREHKTPSYLIREENGAEIVGELPPTVPPVIGE